MSFNLANIEYDGKELGWGIVEQAYSTSTLASAFGVKKLFAIKSFGIWSDLNFSGVLEAKADVPAFSSSTTYNENKIEVCQYMLTQRIPNSALNGTFRERYNVEGQNKQTVMDDAELFAKLVGAMIKDAAIKMDNQVFNSQVYLGDCSNGLKAQFEDPTLFRPVPTAQKLTAVSITSSNVTAELDKVIAAMPEKFRYGAEQLPNLAFGVSPKVADAFAASTRVTINPGMGINGAGNQYDKPLYRYAGYPIIALQGLTDNQIMFTSPDNLAIVLDNDIDANQLTYANGREDATQIDATSFRLDWAVAGIFGDGEKIVWYR